MSPAILVEAVTKRYGARPALAGITFAVDPGEIVGLLGPNGAGKSTTLSIVATLLAADAGTVAVAGCRLPAQAGAARRALGLVPQREALYPPLSARENLGFFARMQGLRGATAARAIDDALTLVGLERRADEPVARLSGGMRRRLNLACGILHRPRVVLLDEPTVGVDPQSRERIFEAVAGLAAGGAAVLYSTHYMEEAERLCRRVVLIDEGRVLAAGTPAELIAGAGMAPRLEFRTARPLPPAWLDGVAGARALERPDGETAVAVADTAIAPAVLEAAARAGGDVLALALHRPNLADVFFSLTGRALRDDDPPAAGAA
ncbi:MAG TPA: ABC transporter ATP-binding protein [Candidatus Binatia bacterium]|nr:ABC transporter ATP-binding protein [Candidatus Binatia bacterium]